MKTLERLGWLILSPFIAFFLVCWLFFPEVILMCIKVMTFVMRDGGQRALKKLIKNPGPYQTANGDWRYVWIDSIDQPEDDVIGTGFTFRLTTEKPPKDLDIPISSSHGISETVRTSINHETGISVTTSTDDFGRSRTTVRQGERLEDGGWSFEPHCGEHHYMFSFMPFFSASGNLRDLKHFLLTSTHDRPVHVQDRI